MHRPAVCGSCAGMLGPDAPVTGRPVLRQVFDLPRIVVEVTEHQLLAVTCGCGHTTRAAAPERVAGPTNLGAGISAVAVYLSTAQMIPIERVAATIEALFGIRVSTGWVSPWPWPARRTRSNPPTKRSRCGSPAQGRRSSTSR